MATVARGVGAAERIILTDRHRAGDDAPDRETADVIVVVEIVDLELQCGVGIDLGTRQMLDDGLEQRTQIVAFLAEFGHRGTGAPIGVKHCEIKLVVGRFEIDKQVVNLIEDFFRARVRAIDLVDADDRRQARLERLLEHEAGLRQRPFAGVNQQQHPIDHRERALDLAAEIRMARGIDDIDARGAKR